VTPKSGSNFWSEALEQTSVEDVILIPGNMPAATDATNAPITQGAMPTAQDQTEAMLGPDATLGAPPPTATETPPSTGTAADAGTTLTIDPKTSARFERDVDFVIILDGADKSRVVTHQRYNAFNAAWSHAYGLDIPYIAPPDVDTPVFSNIQFASQNIALNVDGTTVLKDKETFPTGKLYMGNGNPKSPDFDSKSDFIINGNELEMRIPWALLNFGDPSRMYVHDDYYLHYGIEFIKINRIYIGIGSGDTIENRIPLTALPLTGWDNKPTFHERLKASYYVIQQEWTK